MPSGVVNILNSYPHPTGSHHSKSNMTATANPGSAYFNIHNGDLESNGLGRCKALWLFTVSLGVRLFEGL